MTRLLVPEVYGLMELVWTVMMGLAMFSDVGLTPNVVQSAHGEDETFLDTIWTVQIVRGSVLFGLTLLVAQPIAMFLGQPDLSMLIPAVGVSTLIEGFTSVSQHVEQRRMNLFRVVRIQLIRQSMAIVAQVAFALVWPTAWAFVVGHLVGTLAYVVGSHFLLRPIPHHLAWDTKHLKEILEFGRWIFAATALHFVAMQSDRIIISKLIGDMAVLGVYAIAIRLAKVLSTLAGQVVTMVLMPSLAEKRRDIGADAVVSEEMSATYYRTKLMIDAAFLVPAGAFCAMASTVVSILYSAEYSSAGPILQILVFASLFELIASEPGALLTAMGRTQHHFWQALLRAVYTVTMLPFGFYLMGFEGVVWAAAFTNLVGAPFYWIELRSFRLFRPLMELPAVAFFSVGFGMGAVADMLLSRLLA